jgi:uncharacterized C2H2 Zn-finger protein
VTGQERAVLKRMVDQGRRERAFAHTVRCPHCDETFEPSQPRQKFCCDAHRQRYRRGRPVTA